MSIAFVSFIIAVSLFIIVILLLYNNYNLRKNHKTLNNITEDKNEYTTLLNDVTDGIFVSDKSGKYIDANNSACQMLGYTKEELLQLNLRDLLTKEEVQTTPLQIEELLKGKTILMKRNLLKKDGSLLPVEINSKMLPDGNMMGMVRDITKRKIAEDKLVESERLYRQTLDTMLEGIQIHDFDWKYTYVNDALIKYSKYTREELLGYPITEKYPGIEQTELFKVMDKCMKEKVSKHLETEFVFPDKSIGYFELSIQPLPTGLFILSIDISERKKTEEKIQKLNEELEQKVVERTAQLENNIRQLKESEEKFQKAFQTSAAGITLTRLSDSKYIEVNTAFAEMIGYSVDELLNHSSTELGIVINIPKREEALRIVRETGSLKHFEITIQHRSGNTLDILSSIETITLNGEKYAINIIFDITDRKRMEEQLETINRELEAFTYSISHDLRAPLRAIDGYAKILEEDYNTIFDNEGKRLLGVIQSNATRMSHLIDDLLAFSRLGRKAIQTTTLNMKALVEAAIIDFNRSTNHNAEIVIHNLPDACGDYTLISQVILNLLSNAVKYSSKVPKPVIEIYSEEKEKDYAFSIKDNGVGFDMIYADKLFGVFQRLHKQNEFEGTGVGLAIVQRIINKHGGKIWANAEPNKGATFSFTLPKQ